MDEVVAQEVPETLANFIRDNCRLSPAALRPQAPAAMPDRERALLVHTRDMTSTLAAFHGSRLAVEVLQHCERDDCYLREVFLRTEAANRIVEYGVIAIALDQFGPVAQDAIRAGRTPLGAVLHECQISFQSAPIGYFAVAAKDLETTPLTVSAGATCYGRFNRLSTPRGEPLAWILEILPPS
jgi:hypothetical protein